ncbi:helix-turn-helix transcriptional regulator [Cohnella terricola]|uniref:Helix-turn-helix transcriptional regulator n=1 Tax=Cohnella terricola TaxID=1289167 RepID=A0A559JBV2_9BACL|nr:helix-turn-helix transcriptional regulator [Cohnella terricola]TVX97333.1 helix-turn-helix transcriptional regulator [Cohnella terricola]
MNSTLPKSRLAELRKEFGLTQEKIAEELGINKNTVSSVETSRRFLTIDKGIEIAQKYGVTLDWLYGLKDAAKDDNVLDNFRSFFSLGKLTIPIETRSVLSETSFLTMHLSNVVRDYLLEMKEIERINEEKDLPEPAYKAWSESVKAKYLKELEEKGAGETAEFVLIMNDEHFGSDVAYCIARRQLPELSARVAMDKMNFDKE